MISTGHFSFYLKSFLFFIPTMLLLSLTGQSEVARQKTKHLPIYFSITFIILCACIISSHNCLFCLGPRFDDLFQREIALINCSSGLPFSAFSPALLYPSRNAINRTEHYMLSMIALYICSILEVFIFYPFLMISHYKFAFFSSVAYWAFFSHSNGLSAQDY